MKRQQVYDTLKDFMNFMRTMEKSKREAITIEDSLEILKRKAEERVRKVLSQNIILKKQDASKKFIERLMGKERVALTKLIRNA